MTMSATAIDGRPRRPRRRPPNVPREASQGSPARDAAGAQPRVPPAAAQTSISAVEYVMDLGQRPDSTRTRGCMFPTAMENARKAPDRVYEWAIEQIYAHSLPSVQPNTARPSCDRS